MFFFPYRPDVKLPRKPVLTLLFFVICFLVYSEQVNTRQQLVKKSEHFCASINDIHFLLSISKITGGRSARHCGKVLIAVHNSRGDKDYIRLLAENADQLTDYDKEESVSYISKSIASQYEEFRTTVPETLLYEFAYKPGSYNVLEMVTSIFTHADIFHLVGNLVFFFAFAAAVEVIIGWLKYLALIFTISVGESIAYSISVIADPGALPTVGLSGVVMGMIGLLAYLVPTIRLRCIFYFIIILRTVIVPAWILAIVYIGWDIFDLNYRAEQTNVNLVAHVSGALIGILFGLIFLRKEKKNISNLTLTT